MFKKLIPLLIIVLILTVATIIKKQSTKEQFDLIQELGAQNILDDKFLGSEVDQIELYLGTKIDSKVTLKKKMNNGSSQQLIKLQLVKITLTNCYTH